MSSTRDARLALRAIRAARTHLERASCTFDVELARRITIINQELSWQASRIRAAAEDLEARRAKAQRRVA